MNEGRTTDGSMESRRERHERERREEEALAENLSILGLETLIERAVHRGNAAVLASLEAIKVTLQQINESLTQLESVESTLPEALSTIATNIKTIQDELAAAGNAGGITAADAEALAARIATDGAALQTIADTVAQVESSSGPPATPAP